MASPYATGHPWPSEFAAEAGPPAPSCHRPPVPWVASGSPPAGDVPGPAPILRYSAARTGSVRRRQRQAVGGTSMTATSGPVAQRAPGQARRGTHPGLALAVIAGAQLMVVLDATIVNIALPHIQSALHFSTTSLSWVLNAYTLT